MVGLDVLEEHSGQEVLRIALHMNCSQSSARVEG